MTHLTELAETMQALLTTQADEIARQCGFVKRKRKVSGANFAQTVVFTAMADSQPTENRLHITAAAVGLNASRQALDKRFNAKGAEFLRELLRVAVEKMIASPVAIPLLQRFTSVEVFDSSTIALLDELADIHRGGGSGTTTVPKAAIKMTVGLDLKSGKLRGPELGDGRAADLRAELAEADPPPGGLQLADLNYFSLTKFARWQKSGAYWISRLKSGTKVFNGQGHKIDLVTYLRAAGDADVEIDVELGSEQRLPCRLIARRVPTEVAAQRRQRLLDKCKKRGNRPSALSLALCDWTILVTNVPRVLLSVEEGMALGRMRWQIELIFKLWKSRGRIDEWRGSKPRSALCETYGKLLAQLVRHWVIVVGAWSLRDRSMTKAADIVATLAMSMAVALRCVGSLRRVLNHARQMMQIAARMEKHGKSPNAHDLIFCLDSGP
jgi:hypothetical protein